VSAGETAIDMTWNDNSDNEDGFRVERRLGQGGSFSTVATLGAGVESHTDTGRDPDTEYCYRVIAHNADGDSNPSNVDCATTDAEPPPPSGAPAAPDGLNATSAGETAIDMTWNDNSDDEDGFRVERRLGQDGSFSTVANLGAGVESHTDSGRDPDTEYCYRVRRQAHRPEWAMTPSMALTAATATRDV
jgi:hypothetical protein